MSIRNLTYDGVVNPGSTSIVNESYGTGNGVTTSFAHTSAALPVIPGTVTITAGSVVAADDGNGNLTGTGIASSSVINYSTGVATVNFVVAPANLAAITTSYTNGSVGKIYNELVPTIGGILAARKIVSANVINQAAGLPTEATNVGVIVQGSQDGITYVQIAQAILKGGGAAMMDWGFAKYPYIQVFTGGIVHLSLVWNNLTI